MSTKLVFLSLAFLLSCGQSDVGSKEDIEIVDHLESARLFALGPNPVAVRSFVLDDNLALLGNDYGSGTSTTLYVKRNNKWQFYSDKAYFPDDCLFNGLSVEQQREERMSRKLVELVKSRHPIAGSSIGPGRAPCRIRPQQYHER